jgi:predicted alpha/beta hydrolase family esterase
MLLAEARSGQFVPNRSLHATAYTDPRQGFLPTVGLMRTAIFVHGAGGGGWEWGVWARVFAAEGLRVVAPDLQPARDGLAATTLADYSGQVARWLAAVSGPRVLVGASLGGRLAQLNAGAASALVLVNPVPAEGSPDAARRPAIVPWGRNATLAGTRRALPDADALAAYWAFRRWRDESGRALDAACQPLASPSPGCPVLVFASLQDEDVPPQASLALANAWGASVVRWPGSHVGPLLGSEAADAARRAVEWLNGLDLAG